MTLLIIGAIVWVVGVALAFINMANAVDRQPDSLKGVFYRHGAAAIVILAGVAMMLVGIVQAVTGAL